MTDIHELVPASHHDLLDAANVGALVTLDAHGRPQTTAVWHLVDEEGRLITSITADRQKYKNIAANPEVDFFFISTADPFHTLEVRGTAELVADPDYSGVDKVAEKYAAPEEMRGYLRSGERYTVVITPRKVVTNG